jgi:hypothetical protein
MMKLKMYKMALTRVLVLIQVVSLRATRQIQGLKNEK